MIVDGFGTAEKLALFVSGILLASNVGFLVVLHDFAALAHLLDTGPDLHN